MARTSFATAGFEKRRRRDVCALSRLAANHYAAFIQGKSLFASRHDSFPRFDSGMGDAPCFL